MMKKNTRDTLDFVYATIDTVRATTDIVRATR